jgi:glutaminase
MDVRVGIDAGAESPFVSTGELSPAELVQEPIVDAHARYRTNAAGAPSQVYPALGRVRHDLFGLDWLYDIGLPGKSGAAAFLPRRLGLDLLASSPSE